MNKFIKTKRRVRKKVVIQVRIRTLKHQSKNLVFLVKSIQTLIPHKEIADKIGKNQSWFLLIISFNSFF